MGDGWEGRTTEFKRFKRFKSFNVNTNNTSQESIGIISRTLNAKCLTQNTR